MVLNVKMQDKETTFLKMKETSFFWFLTGENAAP